MPSRSPLLTKAAVKATSMKNYVFRQMRAPLNRHLDEIVSSEVKEVANTHYLNEIARTIDSAAVCRCQVRYDGNSSSATSDMSSPRLAGSLSGGESPTFFYANPSVDNASSLAPDAMVSFASRKSSTFGEKTTAMGRRYARRTRMSFRTTAAALKAFRSRLVVLDKVVSRFMYLADLLQGAVYVPG